MSQELQQKILKFEKEGSNLNKRILKKRDLEKKILREKKIKRNIFKEEHFEREGH